MKITWLVRRAGRAGRKGGVQDKKSKSYRIESNLLLVWRTNSNKSRCASCADGMEPLKLFLRDAAADRWMESLPNLTLPAAQLTSPSLYDFAM